MNNINQNVETLQTEVNQPKKPIKQNGILIYQEAKIKLQISNSGKIYKQKVLSYIPFIGPLFSLIYANLCIGKTRCLRQVDSRKFKSAGRSINWFGFVFWPIIFLGIWTLLQYLLMDFGNANQSGAYVQMWKTAITNWETLVKGDIGLFIGSIFTQLFLIAVDPLINLSPIAFTNAFSLSQNIIFIASLLILTFINPVNIVNSCVLNAKSRRFVVVLEDSSVYQYR